MKHALMTCVVRWSGGSTTLREGMTVDDDHPLVIERPDLFGDGDAPAQLPMPPRIERATREPGQRSPARPPRKTAAPNA
ncbi:hypothetical protein ACIRL2_29120 [Embleya sp. NPDC127516]|uniref:hypothetical protein n=1 Tax=Embleya sp. NPDC127516 TaxID=3363990 RepID=UPI003829AAFE